MSKSLSRFQPRELATDTVGDSGDLFRHMLRASGGAPPNQAARTEATPAEFAGPPAPPGLAPFNETFDLGTLGADGIAIRAPSLSSVKVGFDVAGAGDINGDGIDDFLVSASDTAQVGGTTYVVFGQDGGGPAEIFLDTMTLAEGFKIVGDNPWDRSGTSISVAGDVNGDGYDDILIGSPGAGPDSSARGGAAYLIFGKATGFANLDLTTLSAADGFKIQEDASGNNLGQSVAFADLNDDGYDDMIIGAPMVSDSDAGSVYVVFGKASGLGAVDLLTMSAADGFKISGVAASLTGDAAASAGDVNGDGIADIIIGARGADIAGAQAGAAYVIFGRTSGFTSFNLSALTATEGFKIQGADSFDRVGASVDSAGDVNGDGYDDVIVGAPVDEEGGAQSGTAYVIFGKASGFSTVDLATLTLAQGFKIVGANTFDHVGFSVAGVGDINADGYDDIAVGTPDPDSTSGAVYVIFGRASGFENIDLGNALVAAQGFRILAEEQSDSIGYSVSAAGDVNEDGVDDLILGAPGTEGAFIVYGRAGSGTAPIVGTPGDDALYGTAGVDDIRGLAGNDYLEGGGSPDRLSGGPGNDVYVVEEAADLVVELANEGSDTVYTAVSYTLSGGSSVEILSARDAQTTNALVLVGNELANTLVGNNGNNDLDGAGGGDVMIGFGGNDSYHIRTLNDMVVEAVGGGAADVVFTPFDFTLPDNQEIEYLRPDNVDSTFALNLHGNNFRNILLGNAGVNSLFGEAGDDGLYGYAGDDFLDGGTGADFMEGGQGNDIYVVDNSGDLVREQQAHIGTDRAFTTVSFALEANSSVELLAAFNNALTDPLQLTGNNLANVILANNGNNVLFGNESGDTLLGFGGNDHLDGGSGADVLEGGAGNDYLDGGTGADYMAGGSGDDIYVVDNAGDQVNELDGEGADAVYTSLSHSLGGSVESLYARDNSLTVPLTLTGSEAANTIAGNNGANTLSGNGGADILIGFGGNDYLDGGTGADDMSGGSGNDVYIVDNAGDRVFEVSGEGSDTVYASVSYTLAAGNEIEVLSARDISLTTALSLTGNDLANAVLGNNGANVIDGKGGSDSLVGFGGADTFAFTTALGAGNVDWIYGFSAADDTIALDDAVFTGLSPGALPAGAFVIGTAAVDADDRILYDSATGYLYFDADGNGAGAAVQFARLDGAPAITAADFMVI